MFIDSLEYGSKLIVRILDMNPDVGNIDIIYIAIKAYRIITDPDCGFFKRAACSTDDNFSDLYSELMTLFEPRILKIYELVTSLAGSDALGISHSIFDPVLVGKGNQTESQEARTDVQELEVLINIFRELRQTYGMAYGTKSVGDAFYKSEEDNSDLEASIDQNGKIMFKSEREIDKKIESFLNNWKTSSESQTLNAEDFLIVPPVGEKPNDAAGTSKKNENVILATFVELLKLIPSNPYNEFLKGSYFIGKVFCHSNNLIQSTASVSFQKTIILLPKHRFR